jgi:hypothetical protein
MSRKKPARIVSNNRYLQALFEHYNAPLEDMFKQFRLGAIAFGLGLGLVITAHTSMAPSLGQELLVLAGLVGGGLGFIIAMMTQLRMMIGRFVRFFWEDK